MSKQDPWQWAPEKVPVGRDSFKQYWVWHESGDLPRKLKARVAIQAEWLCNQLNELERLREERKCLNHY